MVCEVQPDLSSSSHNRRSHGENVTAGDARAVSTDDLQERLGLDEWCRRLEQLDLLRSPLLAERDRLDQELWGNWAAREQLLEQLRPELPAPIRTLMTRDDEIRQRKDQVANDLKALWTAKMEEGR